MKFPKRFFRRIFRNILQDHDLDLEVRCLHPYRDKESFWPKQFWCASLVELKNRWPEIKELNLQGYNIHFTVIARRRKFQGKKEHPLPHQPIWICFWVDLDVGEDKPYRTLKEAYIAIRKSKLHPDIIIESGSGLHCYYLLAKPRAISLKRGEALLKAMTAKLRGDKGAARATRLMRFPGTRNWKTNPPRLARVRYRSRHGYRMKDLEACWKPDEINERSETIQSVESGRLKYAIFYSKHVKGFSLGKSRTRAKALCPFHDDHNPSLSINMKTGQWKCWACEAKGDLMEFCKRLKIPLPSFAIQRFPRLRAVPEGKEWPTEKVFETAFNYVTSQVYFTRSWQPVVVTLWAMGTYLHRNFPCYGHVWLNSPTTHSGKTKLLDVLSTLCYKATEPQLDPTSAVLFRFPSSIGGTLLLDEIDKLDPEKQSAVISVLNSYKSSGGVMRNTPGKNKQYVVEKFKVYCPKVIAGIDNLPETLQDRCIKIYLHRKRKTDKVERFVPAMFEKMKPLRSQIDAWSDRDGMSVLKNYHQGSVLPAEADDRLKDLMEPLFAIASVMPKWVREKLTEATEMLARDRKANEEESNAVVLGVQALKEHFPKHGVSWQLRSDKALQIFQEDVPGIDTKSQAQALLRRFGLRSVRVRFGNHVLRAYVVSRKALDRLVERYGLQNVT
jgi:hypothetical protein